VNGERPIHAEAEQGKPSRVTVTLSKMSLREEVVCSDPICRSYP
jgi:hypothetical protein